MVTKSAKDLRDTIKACRSGKQRTSMGHVKPSDRYGSKTPQAIQASKSRWRSYRWSVEKLDFHYSPIA